ncbi:DNA polymerase beta [Porphyridium purpureum]|uniref:DNA polymerase beta n=1 Tax=Porphyridium purpureum TaxID=35688 RepID=A0A5J4YI13_PORPP|nr:DNA polymerase beta [Porphyridium purpureum]|eukprot:POR7090..scf237_24
MFELEYAKTARSQCSFTKKRIEKDELRVGMMVDFQGQPQKRWYSVDGFFEMQDRKRDESSKVRDFAEFEFSPTQGFDVLLPHDKAHVEQRLVDLHDEEQQAKRKAERAKLAKEKRNAKKKQDNEHDSDGEDDSEGPSSKRAKTEPGSQFKLPDSEIVSGPGWQKEASLKTRDYARQMHAKLPADDKEAAKIALRFVMLARQGESVDVCSATQQLLQEVGIQDAASSAQVLVQANSGLVSALSECAKFARNQGDGFKGTAFKKAADAIAELDFEVTSGSELSKGAKKVAGIGKSIATMIDEYIASGTMSKLEEYRSM